MPAYGDFETVGDPLPTTEQRSGVATVWKARNIGVDDGRVYAVKCYAPQRRLQTAASGEELEHDGGLRFAEGIKDLRKACQQGGRCLARIHDFGITQEGVWYVTDFYPRTLEKFITLRGRVDADGLRHIVGSVVAGCLALKRSRGYSHGNLKTSNVFLVGAPRALRRTAILLGDPYPAAAGQISRLEAGDRRMIGELLQQTVEAQDLRAIGELIFELVEGRAAQRRRHQLSRPGLGRLESFGQGRGAVAGMVQPVVGSPSVTGATESRNAGQGVSPKRTEVETPADPGGAGSGGCD